MYDSNSAADDISGRKNIEKWHPIHPLPPIIFDCQAPVITNWVIEQIDSYAVKVSWDPAIDEQGEVTMYEVRCNGKSKYLPADSAEVIFSDLDSFKVQISIRVLDDSDNMSKWYKKTFTLADWLAPSRVITATEKVNSKQQSVRLSWNPAEDDSGRIAYYEVMLGTGEIFKTAKTFITLKHLPAGVSGTYTVCAVDRAGNHGEWSKESKFFIADTLAPKNGKLFVSRQSSGSVLVNWTPASDNSGTIAGYTVSCNGASQILSGSENMIVFDEVAGAKAVITVQAFDESGNFSRKLKKVFKLDDLEAPEQVTLAPEIFYKNNRIKLSWDRAADNSGKIAYYQILLSDGRLLKTAKNTITLKNLLPETDYSYQVRAVDKAGNIGAWSDSSSFYVYDTIAPSRVKVRAKRKSDTLLLRWKPAKDNVGVTAYTLRYGAYLENSVQLDASETEYLLEDLPFGICRYELTACDAAGNVSKAASGKVNINILHFELLPIGPIVPIEPIYQIMGQEKPGYQIGNDNQENLPSGESSQQIITRADIIGSPRNDTLKVADNTFMKAEIIDLGAGNDTLTLGKNAILSAECIAGVEKINGSENSAIYSRSDFNFENVSGSWSAVELFHDADIADGFGTVYANEWDLYDDVTGTLTFAQLSDDSTLKAEIFTDGKWQTLFLEDGVSAPLENALIRVGIEGEFNKFEKKFYEINLA